MAWYEPSPGEKLAIAEYGGSPGGSFPDFTGSGSPEGVVTAAVGKVYQDTANGALYVKRVGTGNSGWVSIGGLVTRTTPGAGVDDHGGVQLIAGVGGQVVLISDADARSESGTDDALVWNNDGNDDGAQGLDLFLGPSDGQKNWRWLPDGTTEFPGPIIGEADGNHSLTLLTPSNGTVTLSDVDSFPALGNGFYYQSHGVDGDQSINIDLGSSSQFHTRFNADGTTEFPGPITGPTGLLPIADATDVTVTDVPNTVIGSGTMKSATAATANDAPVLVCQVEGDAFPRLIILSTGYIYFGDGTIDPYNSSSGGFLAYLNGRLALDSGPGGMSAHDDMLFSSGMGPVIHDDTDGHTYRIGSHNGAVTLTQVT